MLEAMIRAAIEEFARKIGFPERLKQIPVYDWIALFRGNEG
jgi:hypothetical protein